MSLLPVLREKVRMRVISIIQNLSTSQITLTPPLPEYRERSELVAAQTNPIEPTAQLPQNPSGTSPATFPFVQSQQKNNHSNPSTQGGL
jgi:hypothetical protein